MAIVFIGTPDFSVPCLRVLVARGHQIAAVVTQPDREAGRGRHVTPPALKIAALELGLKVMQPATLRVPDAVAEIAALKPELILTVAYGQILRQDILDIPARGILNLHPSLLPRWRGPSPIPAAIISGDRETGVSVILMDAGMDSGPLLAQRSSPIEPEDSAGSLSQRLAGIGAELLADTVTRWLGHEVDPVPQDAVSATTCPLLRKEDGVIDWSRPADHIWRQVRAHNPWPGAYTALDGELLHIWEAWSVPAALTTELGTVLQLTDEQRGGLPKGPAGASLGVQTGEGLLVPLRLQRAGHRALGAADFVRGMPGMVGRRLGQ